MMNQPWVAAAGFIARHWAVTVDPEPFWIKQLVYP